MQNQDQKIIRLNPLNYKASVRQFLNYFDIKERAPGMPLLVDVLTHYAKLPYENISKIVKLHKNYIAVDRIRLPDEVIEDHLAYHLGGTCFSLTFTLQTILTQLNFVCYPFIAHMNNRPNSHCALVVLLNDKKYLVDPGYLLNRPMQLDKDSVKLYRTEHTGIELLFKQDEETYHLYTFDQNNVKWRYQFQDKPLTLNEFLHFWSDSFYWAGMRAICLTQVKPDGMVYVNKNFVQVQNLHGKKKGHVEDIHRLVNEIFHIAPEWVEHAQSAIPDIIRLGQEQGHYRKKT